MNVKKFVANTSREALRKVRDALGSEAIILSNRALDHGVEILAMSSQDMASLAEPASDSGPPAHKPANKSASQYNDRQDHQERQDKQDRQDRLDRQPDREPGLFGDSVATVQQRMSLLQQQHEAQTLPTLTRAIAPAWTQPTPEPVALANTVTNAVTNAVTNTVTNAVMRRRPEINQAAGLVDALDASRQVAQQTARTLSSIDSTEMQAMMSEIRNMRSMLETQLAELSWGSLQKREPARSEILQELLVAGFSPAMARHLIEQLPAGHSKAQGMNWVKTVLGRNLVTIDSEEEMIAKGGVYALVGPTGVGKTTTTAKLAARVVMRHGANRLALITTDGYRIGGHEQLRIYGKILGVMVHSVKDEADLRIALNELKGKHTVLIDTAGVGQRDQMVAEQMAMLAGANATTDASGERAVKRLLCLPATATGATLNEVVAAYQAQDGKGLDGCIITKLDEAASLGSVLDTIVRQKLNVYYVANGQRVPEDLHLANRDYLIDKAFKLKRDVAYFALAEDELPLIMAQTYAPADLSRTLIAGSMSGAMAGSMASAGSAL